MLFASLPYHAYHLLDEWVTESKPVELIYHDWLHAGGVSNVTDDPFVLTSFTYNHLFSETVSGNADEPPLHVAPWTAPFASLFDHPGLIYSFDIGGTVGAWTTYEHQFRYKRYANKIEHQYVPGLFYYSEHSAQEKFSKWDGGNTLIIRLERNRFGQREHENRKVFTPIEPPGGGEGGGEGGSGGTGGGGATP